MSKINSIEITEPKDNKLKSRMGLSNGISQNQISTDYYCYESILYNEMDMDKQFLE